MQAQCTQGLTLEDLAVCGLVDPTDGGYDAGLSKTEDDLDSRGLRETTGKILITQAAIEALVVEMSRRVSTAHMVTDVKNRLEEVRKIIASAEEVKRQPLTRVHYAEVKNILNLCTTLEAQCMSALASIEVDTLKVEMGHGRHKRGTIGVHNERAFQQLNEQKGKMSNYTRDLLEKLFRLEGEPVTRTEHVYNDQVAGDGDAAPLGPEAETEVGLSGGLYYYFMSPGTYTVGADVGDASDPPVVRASRLLNVLPMGVVGETGDHHNHLHYAYSAAMKRSALHTNTRFPHQDDLEGLHFSCHPLEEWVLDTNVNITRDVVRRSHMRKLASTYPHVRKFLRDKGIDLDAPPTVEQPIFQNGELQGYASLPAESVAEGAVDAEFDQALEVPFTVASELAEILGARLPTWQEWEVLIRNGASTKFAWGDSVNMDCIDVVPRTMTDGSTVNLVQSFGWLKHTTECPVESVYRYGAEWNVVNRDIGDATGGLSELPTTHIYRSACDYGVCWHPELCGASVRAFTFPLPAAYGLPHRTQHCAAFRLAYSETPPKPWPIIDTSELLSLLEVSSNKDVNLERIYGLLGKPETTTPANDGRLAETWWYLTLGISLSVALSQGSRVTAVTVYDENHALPRPYRRYRGRITTQLKFPLLAKLLTFPFPVDPITRGNCRYLSAPLVCFALTDTAKEARRPGKASTAASKALLDALRFQDAAMISLCAVIDGERVASLCFSL